MDLILWAIQRGREASTYAGLATILVDLHVADASSWAHVIAYTGIGLCGIAAMVMKEMGAPDK